MIIVSFQHIIDSDEIEIDFNFFKCVKKSSF